MTQETFWFRFKGISIQIAVALAYGGVLAILLLSTASFEYISLTAAYPFPYNVLMILLYAFVGLGIVFILNLFFRLTNLNPDRLFMSLLLSPLLFLSTVVVGHIILLFFFRGIPNLILYSFLAFASLYISMFAILFLLLDMLPPLGKQAMVVWYGGSIGAFLGVSIPTLPLFFLFLALAAIDYFTARAVQPNWQERTAASDFLGTMVGGTFMGVGDIVVYSAIIAHSLAYFGIFSWLVALASIGLLFLGVAVLVFRYQHQIDKPIPGLLIVLFGIIPWIPFMLL